MRGWKRGVGGGGVEVGGMMKVEVMILGRCARKEKRGVKSDEVEKMGLRFFFFSLFFSSPLLFFSFLFFV